MIRITRLTVIFLSLTYSLQALAVLDLIVKEKLSVYKETNKSSKVVTTLVRGDVVVVSPVKYSGFRKVLVTYDGKRQAGYISIPNLKLSVIKDRDLKEGSPMIERSSAGGYFSFSYYSQGEGPIDLKGFPDANFGASSGFKDFFGIQYRFPVADYWVLQLSLANRVFFTQGNAEVIADGGTEVLESSASALSFGAFLKIYNTNQSIFWYGAGLEVASISEVEIVIEGGSEIDYTGPTETFIIPQVGLGFDIKAYKDIYIVPAVQAGVAANASPFLFFVDVTVGVNYVF
ncbi:MAG: hypothetical protein HRT45_07345 [Bdellovibrionales bacterium]|nr:hypothetical protein [Bdellovibrionales bacterium]